MISGATNESQTFWDKVSGPRIEYICLAATLLLVAGVIAHILFNLFYQFGAYGDAVWFSVLSWHNHWDLRVPSIHHGTETLFNAHISWFFWLPSAISYLLPLNRITFFVWFDGTLYAILGFGFWLLLSELWPARQSWAVILRCGAAAAFALNGHSQSFLGEAHPEFAGPAFTLVFLWGLVRKNHPVTLIAFILALSQREDMGFHIFGLLFLVLITDRWRRVPPDQWRPMLMYAAAAFFYSLTALALKRFVFHDWGVFRLIYSGPEPFSRVNEGLLLDRLKNLLLYRYWIWGPGVVALFWALASRNPYAVLGWLAFTPWLVLTLLANNPMAGNFGLHYGYPFLIAGAWPLLAASSRFAEPRGLPPASLRSSLVWALLLVAIQQPAEIYPGVRFVSRFVLLRPYQTVSVQAYDQLEQRLPRALTEISAVRADEGVFSIAPYALDMKSNKIRKWQWNHSGLYVPTAPVESGVNAVIYFANGADKKAVADLIRLDRLHNHYWLSKTRVYLSTSEDLKNIPAFKDIFVVADPLPPEARSAGPK